MAGAPDTRIAQGGADVPAAGGKPADGPGLDPVVKRRLADVQRDISRHDAKWQECLAFFDGDQYVEVSAVDNSLQRLETREGGSGKARWRPRLTRNRYTSAMVRKASLMTSRVPGYECTAINGDQPAQNAARMAERALLAYYHQGRVQQTAMQLVLYALNIGAGMTWPYWNSQVGEMIESPDGSRVRLGEIGTHILGQREVGWQPGVAFEESRWHTVTKAFPIDYVKGLPGYRGPADLKPDTAPAVYERRKGQASRELVSLTHYLERPTDAEPDGRWLQICNQQIICDPEPYPRKGDRVCLQWLPCILRPHSHRPLGLGEQAVDIQRTYNRTINQIIAWKQLVLQPQMLAPAGSLRQQNTAEPGIVLQYRPVGGLKPEWRPTPDLPQGLFSVLEQCIQDLEELFGSGSLPAGVETGPGIQAVNERDQSQQAMFAGFLADWHASYGEHILELMRERYTEPRMLEVQGRYGVDLIRDFVGATTEGVQSVRVAPGSLEPRTRKEQEQKIMWMIQQGFVDPAKGISAMRAGNSDYIVDSYELDVAKQYREIQQMRAMEDGEGDGPPMVNPTVDNHAVHLDVLQNWMKTADYDQAHPFVKEAAQAHAEAHQFEVQQAQMREQQAQSMRAEQMGQQNAGRPGPQGAKPEPSRAAPDSMKVQSGGGPSQL